MADTFALKHRVFKLCQGGNAVSALNCLRKFSEHDFWIQTHLFIVSIQQFIRLQSHFKIDHRVSKLLSVEVVDNSSKLQSNITMKWPASN